MIYLDVEYKPPVKSGFFFFFLKKNLFIVFLFGGVVRMGLNLF